jgi:hypothetical protein
MSRAKPSQRAVGHEGFTVSRRLRLIVELRADPKLAAGCFSAAVADEDPRVHLAALETVAAADGMAST